MLFRHLAQMWLQNTAKAKVRAAVFQATCEQLAPDATTPEKNPPTACHLGLVFALGMESGCFEDLLTGKVTIRGGDFVVREGGLHGRRVVIILCGAGRKNAARATEALIDGHRPQRVISAGFAGGLTPQLARNDILIADQVLNNDARGLAIDRPTGLAQKANRPGVHVGALLTVDHVVRLPRDKRLLHQRYGAVAVEMESFAVAEVCQRRDLPFSSIRVIHDTIDDLLPPDVEHLLVQQSGAGQWGAALGAAWRRPGSIKEMYQLRENALVASLRLARFLAETTFE
jgi:adenosylhomocysteine nucleosidase